MTTQAPDNIILQGTVGSTAQGLAREGSDIDTMGIFVAPTLEIAGLDWHSSKESVVFSAPDPDATFHEVGKFLRLALKANPTILEFLFLEEYAARSWHGAGLLSHRMNLINAEAVRGEYGGYAASQVARFIRNERNGKADRKTARHALRLIEQGSGLLQHGTLTVKVRNPDFYFDMDEMGSEPLIDFMTARIKKFDELEGPFALTEYNRENIINFLEAVRASNL